MRRSRGYTTSEAFRTALEERLTKIAREEGIDLQRIRRQVAFDRLLARLALAPGNPWVLKGGYAMELRYRMARSTKDLDFTVRLVPGAAGRKDRLLQLLQEAASADLNDFFTYRIGEATIDIDGAPYGGARHPVEAVLSGRTFARFHLDIGLGELVLEPAETIRCRDWLGFAHIRAPDVPIISREQQFAEKLHAYTLPRTVAPNSRVRDLVDMVLLIDSGTLSLERTKEAIVLTFRHRGTHEVPTALEPPRRDWEGPFRALAAECGLPTDLAAALKAVDTFHRSL